VPEGTSGHDRAEFAGADHLPGASTPADAEQRPQAMSLRRCLPAPVPVGTPSSYDDRRSASLKDPAAHAVPTKTDLTSK
jgi:hypothetical protein